jgi:drug/metabolite transporter (DMT)-like permease
MMQVSSDRPARLSPRAATLLGLGAILLWGLLALFATATAGLPPFQVTAISFAIGAAAGLGVVAAQGRLALLRQPPVAWAVGVGGLFGYHALYFAALKLAPPAEANLVNYTWPLLIVLISGLLPGERLTARHLVGAALGFLGVAVLAGARGFATFEAAHVAGYLLAVACAFTWASYSLLSRRLKDVPTEAVAGYCLAAALLAGLCHVVFESWVPPSPGGWLALVALGIGPVGAAFFLWDIGVKRGDIQFLGVASYAAPVLSTLALVLTGAAPFGWPLAIACGLIVTGALVAAR